MKIAILLSTYNGEKYLDDLLQSIFYQHCDFKIIVCIRDDGSKDSTLHIIKKWKSKLDIILTEGNNVGPRDSFKELIFSAPICDYYAFCDQDDIWNEDKVAVAVRALKEKGNGKPLLYYCNASYLDQKGNQIKSTRDENIPLLSYNNLIVKNPSLGCEMVFNNELRNAMKLVNFNYYFMHDVVAVQLASCLGEIIYDNVPRMGYRQHFESVTQGHNKLKSIYNKLYFWFFAKDISISNQANELLLLFPKLKENKVIKEVSQYRKGFNRFKLVFNKIYRSDSFKCNRSFILRVILGVA